MGFFSDIKKTNKSDWVVNKKRTLIDLSETHIHFTAPGKEFDVFYRDIKNVEKVMYQIKLETNVDSYTITPKKIRGASDLIDDLYGKLIVKISEAKN